MNGGIRGVEENILKRKPSEVLRIQDLSYRYASDQPFLFEKISLSLFENEFISIVGGNGAGKSTFLKVLVGLLKPTSGRVDFLGNRFSYVSQFFEAPVFFPVSVLEVVLMGVLKPWNFFYSKEARAHALDALEQVGLKEFSKISFSSLSGGQKRRVLIARALVDDPMILFLDEPAAHLDWFWENELYELLKKISQQRTVVIVSHNFHFVSHYTKRIFCFDRGFHEGHDLESLEGKLPMLRVAHESHFRF